tara:strand:+ start:2494 stop:2646 length:153 start_codon:yes stop_codon:yes gene_type:complete
MLFKFGKFWQSIALIICSWILYGIFGFEFTVITFLAIITAFNVNEKLKFL